MRKWCKNLVVLASACMCLQELLSRTLRSRWSVICRVIIPQPLQITIVCDNRIKWCKILMKVFEKSLLGPAPRFTLRFCYASLRPLRSVLRQTFLFKLVLYTLFINMYFTFSLKQSSVGFLAELIKVVSYFSMVVFPTTENYCICFQMYFINIFKFFISLYVRIWLCYFQ